MQRWNHQGLGSAGLRTRLVASGALLAIGSVVGQSSATHQSGPTDALPPVPFPQENPFTEAKRVLGKILFFDEQLSSDNTVSCATCHQPQNGGTDPRRVPHPGVNGVFGDPDDVFASPGVIRQSASEQYQPAPAFNLQPQVTNRSAQPVINSAYTPIAFWDGRAGGTFIDPETSQVAIQQGGALESQCVGPPVSDVEMAHQQRSWSHITSKLQTAVPLALATNLPPDTLAAIQADPNYPALFTKAFGNTSITARRIAFAIATYERTLIADQTDWDAFTAGNPNALSPQEQQGLQLLQIKTCTVCHTPPLFSNVQPTPPGQPPTPIPAMFRNIGLRPPGDDPGRQLVTNIPGDARRFKVPSLRNAALKASFSHTGQFTVLPQMVGFYNAVGQQFPQNRDPLLPIPMAPPEVQAISAFIAGGLVDPRVASAQFPFDRPTLFTQRPNVNVVEIGIGLPGSGGLVPQWIANMPPNVGNTGFKLGVRGALANASATLRVSSTPPVNNIVAPDKVIGPINLGNAPAPALGFATAPWPIPANPEFAGKAFFMQWFVQDPAAPGGLARSRPLQVTIFCGPTGCPDVCLADIDQSGALSVDDFIAFQTAFALGDSIADCDASGTLAIDDFICFQTLFALGC